MPNKFQRNQKLANFLKAGKLPEEDFVQKITDSYMERNVILFKPDGTVEAARDAFSSLNYKVIGMLIERPRKGFLFIINGDGFDQKCSDYIAKFVDHCTLSFACVHRLCFPDDIYTNRVGLERLQAETVIEAINENKIKLADYQTDHLVKMTNGEKDKRPSREYEAVWTGQGYVWHRPATILIKHNRKSYILGRDEGQYFGVELAKNADTIKSGLDGLKPESIRKLKNLKRQGEWFAVPVKKPPESILPVKITALTLPMEEGGNPHALSAKEIVIGKNLFIYCRGFELSHPQHSTLEEEDKKGWFTFVKNTAVRSVSQDGVD